MNSELKHAIANNNGIYEAIFDVHNKTYQKNDMIWYSFEHTPPLYSNLVTRSSEWRPDLIFEEIDVISEKEQWPDWSMKDSFGILDMTHHGFEKLFDAAWIYLHQEAFTPIPTANTVHYETITDEEGLREWRMAWDSNERHREIYDSKLLENPELSFVAGYRDERIVSGFLLNRTDTVVGLSNFFAPNNDTRYWSDMVAFTHKTYPETDIVGYERHMTLPMLSAIGFEPIGDLTVWIKRHPPTVLS